MKAYWRDKAKGRNIKFKQRQKTHAKIQEERGTLHWRIIFRLVWGLRLRQVLRDGAKEESKNQIVRVTTITFNCLGMRTFQDFSQEWALIRVSLSFYAAPFPSAISLSLHCELERNKSPGRSYCRISGWETIVVWMQGVIMG